MRDYVLEVSTADLILNPQKGISLLPAKRQNVKASTAPPQPLTPSISYSPSFILRRRQSLPHIPESSWNSLGFHQFMVLLLHLSQFAHTLAISFGFFTTMSFFLSNICSARPEEACQAMWQCMSHDPGLSALKAITRKPPCGSRATSRRGGLVRVKLKSWELLKIFSDCWRMAKSWPWRWI